MESQPASFMLLPTFIYAPNASIRLGTLLPLSKDTNLPDPGLLLNEDTQENPLPRAIHKSTEAPWTFTNNRNSTLSLALDGDLSVFAPAGASIGLERSSGSEVKIKCDRLETQHFRPDAAYISNALKATFVQEYCHRQRRPSVFLVSGLKVAYGAEIEMKAEKSLTGWAKIFVDCMALAGVPVKVGPSFQAGSNSEKTFSCTIEGPFILAYQLQRLRLRKKDMSLESSEAFNKYALFGDTDPKVDDSSPDVLDNEWKIDSVVEGTELDDSL